MTGPAAADGGERLPRSARLRSGEEIRRTLRAGRRIRGGVVDLFVAKSPAGRPRFAIVVPRHGRTLAERNRLKRRLREIVRRDWLAVAHGRGCPLDAVIRARPAAYGASFEELEASLGGVLGSADAGDDSASSGRAAR